jgi:hypothetical protein
MSTTWKLGFRREAKIVTTFVFIGAAGLPAAFDFGPLATQLSGAATHRSSFVSQDRNLQRQTGTAVMQSFEQSVTSKTMW